MIQGRMREASATLSLFVFFISLCHGGFALGDEHCRNIMNPVFKEAGSSYVRGTHKVYWTLILATPVVRSSVDR